MIFFITHKKSYPYKNISIILDWSVHFHSRIDLTFVIRSAIGKVIQKVKMQNRNSDILFDTFAPGAYILELRNENNKSCFAKFIKQ